MRVSERAAPRRAKRLAERKLTSRVPHLIGWGQRVTGRVGGSGTSRDRVLADIDVLRPLPLDSVPSTNFLPTAHWYPLAHPSDRLPYIGIPRKEESWSRSWSVGVGWSFESLSSGSLFRLTDVVLD